MITLALRLVAPLQSWGTQSNFTHRDTGLEPSKSGVIGVLCAAMGIDRADDDGLQRVAAVKMGVRVDQEGIVKRDYHTVGKGGYMKAKGEIERKTLIESHRYYLADAAFLVGLESADRALLEEIYAALQAPCWPLFLGRKACVPSVPLFFKDVTLAFHEKPLFEALDEFPYRLGPKRDATTWMRGLLEDNLHGEIARQDQPLSFRKGARNFAVRHVRFAPLACDRELPVLPRFA